MVGWLVVLNLMARCYSISVYIGRGGAMVLGKLPVPGRPTIWITVGQGPTALAVGADGGCLDIFTLIYPFFPISPSLWETTEILSQRAVKPKTNQLYRAVSQREGERKEKG